MREQYVRAASVYLIWDVVRPGSLVHAQRLNCVLDLGVGQCNRAVLESRNWACGGGWGTWGGKTNKVQWNSAPFSSLVVSMRSGIRAPCQRHLKSLT